MNIIGRVTKDAKVYTTSKDKQVVNFSLAVNDSYRNKQGQRIVQTTYFDCAYWLTPNVAPMLTKGSLVELSGRVSARAWEGKDGQPQAGLNFHTSEIKFYTSSKKSQATQDTVGSENSNVVAYGITDDLPF